MHMLCAIGEGASQAAVNWTALRPHAMNYNGTPLKRGGRPQE